MELIEIISKADLAERQQISRKNIKENLQTLSSTEEQLDYQRNVPHVNIIDELVCGWFDDTYWPDDKIFRSGFSEEELKAMSEFSQIFEAVLASVQNEVPQIEAYVKAPEWARLLQAAHIALSVFQIRDDN